MKIIVLRALRLGDMLCSVPALRALRAAHPGAEITLAGLPWARAFVDRFSRYLDRFIEFPGWPGMPERPPCLDAIPKFLEHVQGQRFDLAIQMQGSGQLSNPLVVSFGARANAGLYRPGDFRPDPDRFFAFDESRHEVLQWVGLMESLGYRSRGTDLEFPLRPEDRLAPPAIDEPYACLHVGASDPTRCWPAERFARVGDHLAARGLRVVLTGMPAELPLTEAVASAMHTPPLNVAELALPIGPLAFLLGGAQLLVSNDTGVAHLANAVGLPGVLIFTTADPRRWAPLERTRHEVIENGIGAPVEEVNAAVDRLLARRRAPTPSPSAEHGLLEGTRGDSALHATSSDSATKEDPRAWKTGRS